MREGSDRVQAHVDVLRASPEIDPAERRVLFGHSVDGLIGLLGAIDGLVFDAMVLYEPIVTVCLRTDLPGDVALLDWDRMIVAEVVRGVSTGDPAGGISAFVTAWNEVFWSDLPSAVCTRLIASAELLSADLYAVSYHDLHIDRLSLVRMPVDCGHMGPVQMPAAIRSHVGLC